MKNIPYSMVIGLFVIASSLCHFSYAVEPLKGEASSASKPTDINDVPTAVLTHILFPLMNSKDLTMLGPTCKYYAPLVKKEFQSGPNAVHKFLKTDPTLQSEIQRLEEKLKTLRVQFAAELQIPYSDKLTDSEFKKAYRKRMLIIHPDKYKGNSPQEIEERHNQAVKLNQLKESLDTERRAFKVGVATLRGQKLNRDRPHLNALEQALNLQPNEDREQRDVLVEAAFQAKIQDLKYAKKDPSTKEEFQNLKRLKDSYDSESCDIKALSLVLKDLEKSN